MTEEKQTPQQEAEERLEENYLNTKSGLTLQQKRAVKAYREVIGYLGIDVITDTQTPVLAPDKVVTDALYLTLTDDQLMYYVGVLSGIRPYLGEELIDAKARALYSTVWRKFNEVGFRATFRQNALSKEIERIEKKIKDNKSAKTLVKKHYTEDNLKDESQWRNYIWSKLEADKLRKAELLEYYARSIDSLIVALKERVRYMNPEKGQAGYGDQLITPMP